MDITKTGLVIMKKIHFKNFVLRMPAEKDDKLPRGRAIGVLSGIYIFYEKPAVFQAFPFFTPRSNLEEFFRLKKGNKNISQIPVVPETGHLVLAAQFSD